MTKYIGAKIIASSTAANVAGIWSLDDITFFRTYGYITDSTAMTVVQNFTSSSTWRCPDGVTTVEYLVLAGGGGGGLGAYLNPGFGAGGGGFRTGSGLSVNANTSYTITIGAGGGGGSIGSSSFFGISPATPGGIQADGGGAGAPGPQNGGSGGAPAGLGNLPNVYSPAQGYNATPGTGRGGGAGGPNGQNAMSSITGTARGYGAGGGGTPLDPNAGSQGGISPGGGAGYPGGSGTANFGGGGWSGEKSAGPVAMVRLARRMASLACLYRLPRRALQVLQA